MWSSVGELYPTYFNPAESPIGSVRVVEPKVVRSYDYRPVQPQKAPYELKP